MNCSSVRLNLNTSFYTLYETFTRDPQFCIKRVRAPKNFFFIFLISVPNFQRKKKERKKESKVLIKIEEEILLNEDAKIMGEPRYKKHKEYQKIEINTISFSENNISTLTRRFACRFLWVSV